MDLQAYTRNIKDILTLNRKYIIPRFQREYAWEKEELKEFFRDLIKHIEIENNALKASDYFIGSLVLVGNDNGGFTFDVVDGQQRLTTITVVFSVLTQILKELGEESLVDSCYMYIEGKDDDNKPFFKLENESPKPFLQHRIQNKDIETAYEPMTDEEKKLMYAYDYFYQSLNFRHLKKSFIEYDKDISSFSHVDVLKSIREQLKALSVIFITVGKLEDANSIFETLNAKGKDLEAIDLVKNEIFKTLNDEHPTDSTKDKWRKIKDKLLEREEQESLTTFFRHFWLSKYSFVQKSGIFSSFKKEIPECQEEYESFLNALVKSTQTYVQIISPQENDWPRIEKKQIYDSILALNIFNVSQARPLLMALLETNIENNRILKHPLLIKFLKLIENFHFVFTAIASSRASNIESNYSRISIKIRKARSAEDMNNIYEELYKYIQKRVPPYEIFEAKFKEIQFTKEITRSQNLVKYILYKMEEFYSNTDEFIIRNLSIEHISDQSFKLENVGCLGNLIPLSQKINSEMNTKDFVAKLPKYEESNFNMVKSFLLKYGDKKDWKSVDIDERTIELAKLSYDSIWKI